MADLLKNALQKVDYISIGENFQYNKFAEKHIGLRLFPIEKVESLELAIRQLVKEYDMPRVALVHAFDSESLKGDRPDVEQISYELLLVKESLNIGEELRKRLLGVFDPQLQTIVDAIYNDAENLISAVLTRFEAMADELLSTGKVTIKENNIDKTIEYNIPQENYISFVDWDDPNHSILNDLSAFIELHPNVKRMFTTTKVIGWMLANKEILEVAKSLQVVFPTINWLSQYISTTFGISIVNVEKQLEYPMYKRRYHDTQKYRFFPEVFATFVETEGELGKTYFTYTPVEDLNRMGEGGYPYSKRANVVVYKDVKVDPAEVKTVAEAVGLPVLANSNGIYITKFI